MPHGFASRSDVERVARATEYVERMRRQESAPRQRWFRNRGEIVWYRLTANLDCGGTATAKRGVWDAANSVWDDTGDEETLTDTTGAHWGLEGEWLPGRPGRGLIEVLASGKEHHVATLTANLLTGDDATATVAIDGVTADVTVYDHADLGMATGKKIASGGKVRIWYETEDEKWYADWAKCSAVVAQ